MGSFTVAVPPESNVQYDPELQLWVRRRGVVTSPAVARIERSLFALQAEEGQSEQEFGNSKE